MTKSTKPQEEEIRDEVVEEAVDTPVSEAPKFVDINIASMRKQRFRINGDNSKILELNVSDMGIVTRLSELYPKLQELADKAATIGNDTDDASDDVETFKQQLDKLGGQLKDIDEGMRDYIDKLFDANVSEVCAPFGHMYDIVDGQFRYDNIIDTLAGLYEANIEKETKALKDRLAKKTAKYTTQDRKRSSKKK